MTDQQIIEAVLTSCGWNLTKFRHESGQMIFACPQCKSTSIEMGDCGYNTFNPGWVRCKKCKYSVDVSDVDNGGGANRVLAKVWNTDFKSCYPPILTSLDACHEVLPMKDDKFRLFVWHHVVGHSYFKLLDMTARDWCMAYLAWLKFKGVEGV